MHVQITRLHRSENHAEISFSKFGWKRMTRGSKSCGSKASSVHVSVGVFSIKSLFSVKVKEVFLGEVHQQQFPEQKLKCKKIISEV